MEKSNVINLDPKLPELICPECGGNHWELYGRKVKDLQGIQSILCIACGTLYALAEAINNNYRYYPNPENQPTPEWPPEHPVTTYCTTGHNQAPATKTTS